MDSISASRDVGGVVMLCGVRLISRQQNREKKKKTLTQRDEIMTQFLLHGSRRAEQTFKGNPTLLQDDG